MKYYISMIYCCHHFKNIWLSNLQFCWDKKYAQALLLYNISHLESRSANRSWFTFFSSRTLGGWETKGRIRIRYGRLRSRHPYSSRYIDREGDEMGQELRLTLGPAGPWAPTSPSFPGAPCGKKRRRRKRVRDLLEKTFMSGLSIQSISVKFIPLALFCQMPTSFLFFILHAGTWALSVHLPISNPNIWACHCAVPNEVSTQGLLLWPWFFRTSWNKEPVSFSIT